MKKKTNINIKTLYNKLKNLYALCTEKSCWVIPIEQAQKYWNVEKMCVQDRYIIMNSDRKKMPKIVLSYSLTQSTMQPRLQGSYHYTLDQFHTPKSVGGRAGKPQYYMYS